MRLGLGPIRGVGPKPLPPAGGAPYTLDMNTLNAAPVDRKEHKQALAYFASLMRR